ncbi:MAG: hypothetical protein GC159_02160 [Phycisphaera sp.]|nr:hypothetical protein [Phycisphaera sp.]
MRKAHVKHLFVNLGVAALLIGLAALTAQSQDKPTDSPERTRTRSSDSNSSSDRRSRGNFDPEEFRKRMNERLKEQLGSSDEEWKIIEPRLTKVTEAQRATRGGGGFMFGGFSGRGGSSRFGSGAGGGERPGGDNNAERQRPALPDDAPDSLKKTMALRELLDNKDSSPEDIKKAVDALREAKKKAEAELEAARAQLKEVLTVRQEATLVMMGILE